MKDANTEYFAEFAQNFCAYILPYRRMLSGRFSAITGDRLSVIIYLGENFVVVRLIKKWIGEQVKTVKCPDINPLLHIKFGNMLYPPTDHHFHHGFQLHNGSVNLEGIFPHRSQSRYGLRLGLNKPSCFTMIDAHIRLWPKTRQVGNYSETVPESGEVLTTNWLMQYVSYKEEDALAALDDDPRLFAYAIANHFLMAAKVRTEDYYYKHFNAASELQAAAQSDTLINERNLQELVEGKPWIIHEQNEYLECLPEPRLHYDENNYIEPDFVFRLQTH